MIVFYFLLLISFPPLYSVNVQVLQLDHKIYFYFLDLPQGGPTIETPRQQYQVGETADLMCIAQLSNPPSNLSWYINGEPVSEPFTLNAKFCSIAPCVIRLKTKFRENFRCSA